MVCMCMRACACAYVCVRALLHAKGTGKQAGLQTRVGVTMHSANSMLRQSAQLKVYSNEPARPARAAFKTASEHVLRLALRVLAWRLGA